MPTLALVDTRRVYDHLFGIYVPIAVGVFVLFSLLILGLALRGRLRPAMSASRLHENNPIELSYALLLVAVVAFLLWLSFSAEHKVDSVSLTQRSKLTVDVVASQWEWTFYYPGYRITHESGTVGRQPLVVPTGVPVRFNLYSRDVIHAMWIPYLRFKRDLIQGTREVVVLDFPTTGLFQGHCSQFCGLRHALMLFNVRAISPRSFATWARSGGRQTPWRDA